MARATSLPIQKLFEDGIRAATRKSDGERCRALSAARAPVDDKLVFRKVRERFGGG